MTIDPGLAIVIVALIQLIGLYFTRRTLKVAQRTEENTNSMREQLVVATAKASFSAGKAEGRSDVEAENAALKNKD
jgi:membrane protein implicated in regulation of membrane protease activity